MNNIIIISNPTNKIFNSDHVIRGSSWDGAALHTQSAYHTEFLSGHRLQFIGFRVVKGNKS